MFFTIYGCGGHLGHVTQMSEQNFVPPTHRGSTQNLAVIGPLVLEIFMFESVNRQTDGRGDTRWTPARLVYYKLTLSGVLLGPDSRKK